MSNLGIDINVHVYAETGIAAESKTVDDYHGNRRDYLVLTLEEGLGTKAKIYLDPAEAHRVMGALENALLEISRRIADVLG